MTNICSLSNMFWRFQGLNSLSTPHPESAVRQNNFSHNIGYYGQPQNDYTHQYGQKGRLVPYSTGSSLYQTDEVDGEVPTGTDETDSSVPLMMQTDAVAASDDDIFSVRSVKRFFSIDNHTNLLDHMDECRKSMKLKASIT